MRSMWALAPLTMAVMASTATAGNCDGKAGWNISAPDTAPIGSTVQVDLTGPANEMGFFMVSLGQGPFDTPYGTICLDFPLALSFLFDLDANGQASFSGDIPCDPIFANLTIYMQFITCRPNKGVSNQHALTITDGVCTGDLCGFTQGGWGTDCAGGNPGCRRDKSFDSLFPSGLSIGDPDGIDGDGDFALLFTSSQAVNDFLPAKKGPGILDGDQTDPADSSAGEFAGQLLAATLNVAFDDAGLLDDCKARTDLKLGDLVLTGGVDADLIGWSVRDLIGLANAVISGSLGSGPFDIDGDTNPDVTVSDISDALDVVNQNFDNGTQNNGNLGLP